ncbi:TOBE domain-containing protein [Mycobacterium sp. JS623]|uniref:TOBE domain-containing protein n=1 Tax=Mycobacterium sp. JS623 TaxID=212767 RepID=UPI003FA52505
MVAGESAVALFNPAAVAVYRDKPHGSPRNTVEVTVAELDSRGSVIRVRADEQPDGAPGLAADITAESAAELHLVPGDRVYFSVKAQEVTVHPGP